jgi:phosphotransferase system HPr (HPr) family protein
MVIGTELVSLRAGLYSRVVLEIVKTTRLFRSKITFTTAEGSANAKSLIGLLCLAASYGTRVDIVIEGDDEQQAMSEIHKLFQSKFAMDKE